MKLGRAGWGLLLCAGFSAAALVWAQEKERWLLLRPGQNTQILHTRFGGDPPRGPIIRWTFENHSSHLSRLCHAYLRDQQIPTDESLASLTVGSDDIYAVDADGNIIPSLSKMKRIQEDLLKAAILASDTTLPEDDSPASGSAAPVSSGSALPETEPYGNPDSLADLPPASAPAAPSAPLLSQDPPALSHK
jgi:hypothetical protein